MVYLETLLQRGEKSKCKASHTGRTNTFVIYSIWKWMDGEMEKLNYGEMTRLRNEEI